jgi:hypothetical protein
LTLFASPPATRAATTTTRMRRRPSLAIFLGFWTDCVSGVARWNICTPEIPISGYFGGTWNGKCLYILWPFLIAYGHLVYFMTISKSLLTFGIWYDNLVHIQFWGHLLYFPALACRTKKNLATLCVSEFRWNCPNHRNICTYFVRALVIADSILISVYSFGLGRTPK